MRKKIIKRVAISLMAATMVLGTMTSAFAYTTNTATEIDDEGNVVYSYEAIDMTDDGETVYLAVGNMSPEAWKTAATANILEPIKGLEGVYAINLTFPAYDDAQKWQSRFCILGAFYNEEEDMDTTGTWARMLVGEPAYTPDSTQTCLSNISVRPETELNATVYYDARTATVYIEDADGNAVDYYLSWVGNDDDEAYMTVSEYAQMSYEDYVKALKTDDRRNDLAAIAEKITLTDSLFGETYGKNVAGLAAYVNGGADYTKPVDEKPEDVTPTAGDDETDKPTDEQPTGDEDTTPSGAEDTVVYGDVNDDGQVDIKDVALIKRKLAGWDVVLGPQDKAADSDSGVEDTTPAEDSTSDESTSEDASAGSV